MWSSALNALLLVFVVLIGVPAAEAATTLLRRTPGSILLGPTAQWTDGTTTAIFHPMGDPMALADATKVRVAYHLSEINGPARIRPALRFSNDGVSWDAAQPIDSVNLTWVTNETITFGSAYVDLTTLATPKSWVQFGVQAANSPGGSAGYGNATLRIEIKRAE